MDKLTKVVLHLRANENAPVRPAQHLTGERPVREDQKASEIALGEGYHSDVLSHHDRLSEQPSIKVSEEVSYVNTVVNVNDIATADGPPEANQADRSPERVGESHEPFGEIPGPHGEPRNRFFALLLALIACSPHDLESSPREPLGQFAGDNLDTAAMLSVVVGDDESTYRAFSWYR